MSAPEVTVCAGCGEPIWSGYWTPGWSHYRKADHEAVPTVGNSVANRDRAVARAAELGIDLFALREQP